MIFHIPYYIILCFCAAKINIIFQFAASAILFLCMNVPCHPFFLQDPISLTKIKETAVIAHNW